MTPCGAVDGHRWHRPGHLGPASRQTLGGVTDGGGQPLGRTECSMAGLLPRAGQPFTAIFFHFACSAFGRVSSSTPLRYLASTWSAFTAAGRVTARWNRRS